MNKNTLSTQFSGAKVLITGGMGMIGSNLARKLVKLGAHVTIIDAMLPLYGGNMFNVAEIRNCIDVHIADIRNGTVLDQLIPGKDYIFNLAAQVSYTDSQTDPLLDLDINCRGHLLLLETARKCTPQPRVLFTGSRMQYGAIERNPVSETHPTKPLSIYAIHKLAGEYYHRIYHQLYGLPTVTVRITNPYGPRSQMKHSKYSLINWFIRQAMEDRPIKVFGEGHQIRDYIFVDDIVEGILAVAGLDQLNGQVYNLGGGQGIRFIDMVQTVLEAVGSGHMELVAWPNNYEKIETGDFVADISHLQADTNWQPHVDLATGVYYTHEYYKVNRHHYW